MFASLQTFLNGIIDYAGLFPPAKLPLDQAIRNYARYRQEPESWMLGRFICPADRLAELRPFAELFRVTDAFAFSALGRGGTDVAEFRVKLIDDLLATRDFRKLHGDRVVLDTYEARLPAECVGPESPTAVAKFLDMMALTGDNLGIGPLTCYYEATFRQGWRSTIRTIIDCLAAHNRSDQATDRKLRQPAGFKLRCGGLEAASFPSPEQVAFTIAACRDAGMPLKFTAGLHHPVRCFDPGLQVYMHGFLNVFGAGILARAKGLLEEDVRTIVEDEDPASFRFDDAAFRWKDLRATKGEIAMARRDLVVSFGSCSFDEPRDDLRALGLLARDVKGPAA
jgi:hypothetical protein